MIDILLITPPIFEPDFLLMANPVLLSALRRKGFTAERLDLNFHFEQFLRKCIKISKTSNPKGRLKSIKFGKIGIGILNEYLRSLPRAGYYGITEEPNRNASFQEAELYSPDIATYHYLACNNFPRFIELLHDKIHNPFYLFCNKKKILDNIDSSRPRVVGISVTSPSQLLSTLTLSILLRKKLPECHIVFGGPYVTCYRDEFTQNSQIRAFWDTLITGEGETPLATLLECLRSGKFAEFKRIPNLTYKQKDSLEPVFSDAVSFENINELPTPSYPELKNGDKVPELYIQASRSCYWGKCRYCSLSNNVYPKYRTRHPEKIVEDIAVLQKRHNINNFYFVDMSIPPLMLKQISERLISSGVKATLGCFCRFEKEFSYELFSLSFRAGFRYLNFGLETVNARLASLICKGYNDMKEIDRIINDAHKSGINVKVHAIFGLPTEREHETMETYNFLKERRKICLPIVEVFRLEKNTFFWRNPEKFGIEIIRDSTRELFNNSFRYRYSDPKAISLERALKLRFQFYRELSEAPKYGKKQTPTKDTPLLTKEKISLDRVRFNFGNGRKKIWFSKYIITKANGDKIVFAKNPFQAPASPDRKKNIGF
jgi:radical SAM superfamily enzyme YgiQ (UPF0313 family)